jgi:hypothetical protein
MSNPQQLVQKLWNYCNILRDDGLSFRLRQSVLQKAFKGELILGK